MLEVFAGCARLTAAVHEAGYRTGAPIDIRYGPHCDMSLRSLQRYILRLIRQRRLWYLHLGTPCTRWVPVGGDRNPSALDISLAAFSVRCIRACRLHGVLYTFENPPASRIWKWGPLQRELAKAPYPKVVFDACRFGAPFKKPGGIAGSVPNLGALGLRCQCQQRHRYVLQGLVRHPSRGWIWRTALASAYLPQFCRALALLASHHAPQAARGRATEHDYAAWDHALAATAHRPQPPQRAVPRCPLRYRVPWRPSWPTSLVPAGR